MQTAFSHIIWDWNGTLLCDLTASLRSSNDLLQRRGKPPLSVAEYHAAITVPIRGFYERFFDLEQEDYNAIIAEYNVRVEQYLHSCTLTPGAVEVLDWARERGMHQCIVSSCENNQILRWLAHFGISDYFDEVLGAADFLAQSKVERAQAYLRRSGAAKNRTLAIGDLTTDFDMAQQLGIPCVLLCGGHQAREQLQTTGAPVLEDLREVIALLQAGV